VDALLAARLVFEMLHRIGDGGQCTVDTGLCERAAKQFARQADDRPTREILLIAGLFAHEDNL
jgi:hypothetical protein